MKKHLLFEPSKLALCQVPFSFYEKKEKAGKLEVVYSPFIAKEIKANLEGESRITFSAFSEEEYDKQKTSLISNFQKMQSSLSEYQFLKKNLKNIFYDNFRKIAFEINRMKIFHRYKTSENKFITSACSFQLDRVLSLSFKLKKSEEGLYLESRVEIDGEKIHISPENRFLFLVFHQNTYYMLRKPDWFILDELEDVEEFTFEDFSKNIKKKIEHLPLDLTEAFEEEIREEFPEKIIHISELADNMLLFIPKWRYDGYLVDDSKETFERIEGEKRIIYKRNKAIEQETISVFRTISSKISRKK
jgi:hypothetical protein